MREEEKRYKEGGMRGTKVGRRETETEKGRRGEEQSEWEVLGKGSDQGKATIDLKQ